MPNKNITHNYCCMDCGNLISKPTALKGLGRCRSCSQNTENRTWTANGQIRNKDLYIQHFCKNVNCNNKISYWSFFEGKGFCNSCKQLGDKNHQYGKRNEKCHHTKYSFIESIRNNHIIGTAIWKEFRREILNRDNNICKMCGKKANEIHHIKSRKKYPELCFDKHNVVSMCKPCHLSIEPRNKTKILQNDLDGNFIKEWESIQNAQAQFNPTSSNIWFCLNRHKRQETAHGFKWEYKHLDRAKKKA